jgi:bis(5'-nucleosyl)-tetraphosphatase (symmetrical)
MIGFLMQSIFVGDVQGCAEELGELLARARAAYGEGFELWLVGDLINRGPDNLAALREVRALVDAGRARYVLGNHEIGLLLTAAGLRERKPLDSFGDVLGAPDAAEWVAWLRRRPLLETGQLGDQRFAMVHASVHPAWSLAELELRVRRVEARLGAADLHEVNALLAADPSRDPDRDLLGRLTQARSVTRAGGWSPDLPGGELEAWHQSWAAHAHDYCVVYGHWAWLPDPRAIAPFDVPDGRFWHIPARRIYYQAP